MQLKQAWLLALLASGCAGATAAVTQRDFLRDGVEDLPLQTVELVVVVAGPPRVSDGRFEVRGFDAPAPGVPLLSGAEDPGTRSAVARELQKELEAAGFRVTVRTAQAPAPVAPPPPPPVVPTSTVGAVETASVGATRTASTSTAPAPAPVLAEVPAPPQPVLSATDDVDAIRASSDADAILVVRAVPVDRFTIDVGEGTRWEETPLGREKVRDYRPVATEGRLLIGQAFLIDRSSGLRLWSRQAPDYPADGRITVGHPFLESGYVQAEGESPAPAIVRATASARAFVRKILLGLPRAHEGRPEARAALAAIDAETVRAHDLFFDVGHWVFDLGVGWAGETSAVDVKFEDEVIATLGPGAATPLGMPRLVPRVARVAPGGFLYAFSMPLGLAPSSFGRTYVRDNEGRTSVNSDRGVSVSVGGVSSIGAQAELGQLLTLTEGLFLVPRAGAFVDGWILDAAPEPWIDGSTHLRAGLSLGLDAWLRLGEPWFLRAGLDGRLGGDTAGGLVIGGALTLGAGVML